MFFTSVFMSCFHHEGNLLHNFFNETAFINSLLCDVVEYKSLTECVETAAENKIETIFSKQSRFSFFLIGKTKPLKLLWRKMKIVPMTKYKSFWLTMK